MQIDISIAHGPAELEDFSLLEFIAFLLEQEGCPENTNVSISFVDNDEIQRLNRDYRGKDAPTDVLSFECDGAGMEFPGDEIYELGDIVIASDVAVSQAQEYDTTLREEIELLICHGILHLRGMDHVKDDEAAVMEAREDELLAAWRARS